MAWRDERPGERLRPPLQPAIAPGGRDRERLGPPESVRCHEPYGSGVGRRPLPQDPESAGSTKVARCAALALPPPSDFPLRRRRRNSADVVVPSFTHIL